MFSLSALKRQILKHKKLHNINNIFIKPQPQKARFYSNKSFYHDTDPIERGVLGAIFGGIGSGVLSSGLTFHQELNGKNPEHATENAIKAFSTGLNVGACLFGFGLAFPKTTIGLIGTIGGMIHIQNKAVERKTNSNP